MIRRPPRSTLDRSSAASDVYKRQPQDYALGVVMTGGSLGLLLPPSLPILVYSLVAGIDFTKAFKAALIPGLLVVALLGVHAAYVGIKAKIPRSKPNLSEICLLYTSDAADERSSVDLGGRRIIKKQK